jgi:cytochrome c-type protein NapB
MKKFTLISAVVASLLFVGCGNNTKEATAPAAEKATEKSVVEKATEAASSAVEATKEAATKAVEKTAEVAKDAKKAVEEKATEVKKAVEEKATEAKKAVTEKVADAKEAVAGAVDTKACAACHGVSFEKKAMNVSKIVKDMSKEDIIKALKGYKDGSYGGSMKALMKGQVASYDDAKIEAVAGQIAK